MGLAFDELLLKYRDAVERFVRFRMTSEADADDVLQEVYCTAFRKYETLRSRENFKAWILSIARNKCNDYFRERAKASS